MPRNLITWRNQSRLLSSVQEASNFSGRLKTLAHSSAPQTIEKQPKNTHKPSNFQHNGRTQTLRHVAKYTLNLLGFELPVNDFDNNRMQVIYKYIWVAKLLKVSIALLCMESITKNKASWIFRQLKEETPLKMQFRQNAKKMYILLGS